MLKQHKLISIIIGILFLVVLQVFSNPLPIFRFLVPAFFIFTVGVTYYNWKYLKSFKDKKNLWVLMKPALLLVSLFGIFIILPNELLRSLFLVISVGVITLFEYFLADTSENILINQAVILSFGLFINLVAFTHFFPGLNLLFLAGAFVSGFLISRSFYEFSFLADKAKLFTSLIFGLITAELFWVLTFLPFHFSALAIILFNVFYFGLILNYYYLYKVLTLKKLQYHLLILIITTGFVLTTTPWRII